MAEMRQTLTVEEVVDRVGRGMRSRFYEYQELAQGRSGARKVVCSGVGGEKFFIKFVSSGRASTHQWSLVRREATVLQQLPANSSLPRFVAVIDEPDLMAVVTEYVGDSQARVWDAPRALAAFLTTSRLYEELAGVPVTATPIESKSTRFRVFTEPHELGRIKQMSAVNRAWVTSHRSELAQTERRARLLVHSSSVIHCDLASDNFVFSADGQRCYLVDWSHAYLGQPAYDLACMLVRIRADSAWGPALELSLLQSSHASQVPWRDMLVLAAANFIQRSEGEVENPDRALSDERLRFANAAVDWLRELS